MSSVWCLSWSKNKLMKDSDRSGGCKNDCRNGRKQDKVKLRSTVKNNKKEKRKRLEEGRCMTMKGREGFFWHFFPGFCGCNESEQILNCCCSTKLALKNIVLIERLLLLGLFHQNIKLLPFLLQQIYRFSQVLSVFSKITFCTENTTIFFLLG